MATLYVQEQGTTLRVAQERVLLTKGRERLLDVPVIKVDRVIVMGRGVQVTNAALVFLAQRRIPVLFTNYPGTRIQAEAGAGLLGGGTLRREQVHVGDDPARALPLVQAVISGKLYNQLALLRAHARLWGAAGSQAAATIERVRRDVAQAQNADQVRGYEGAGAAAYWSAWSAAFRESWKFAGRKYNPPEDPLNALLSFGYTLLLNEVLTAVRATSLDPYLGFFHVLEYGRPSLALDIEEEFRPLIVDALVLRLLEAGAFQAVHFVEPAERPGAVYLNDEGRKRFITAYEGWLGQQVVYPYLQREPNEHETWRRCIRLQVDQMARTIEGTRPRYEPLLWPAG